MLQYETQIENTYVLEQRRKREPVRKRKVGVVQDQTPLLLLWSLKRWLMKIWQYI